MAIADLIFSNEPPQTAYLWSMPDVALTNTPFGYQASLLGGQILYFQYWPQSLQDDYQVDYAEHSIPGGSHPLYQWVGGRGRTISFQAVFTSEIDETRFRQSSASLGDTVGQSALTPSASYTVDVDAALSSLRAWMLPRYREGGRLGETDPPPILSLALRGTKLAGAGKGGDVIQVILRSAPITYESWFPNGRPRIATVDLTFNEIVQNPNAVSGASIRFIDRSNFENNNYKFRGLGDRPFLSGSI